MWPVPAVDTSHDIIMDSASWSRCVIFISLTCITNKYNVYWWWIIHLNDQMNLESCSRNHLYILEQFQIQFTRSSRFTVIFLSCSFLPIFLYSLISHLWVHFQLVCLFWILQCCQWKMSFQKWNPNFEIITNLIADLSQPNFLRHSSWLFTSVGYRREPHSHLSNLSCQLISWRPPDTFNWKLSHPECVCIAG